MVLVMVLVLVLVLVRNETAHHAWRAAGYGPKEHWRRRVKPLTD